MSELPPNAAILRNDSSSIATQPTTKKQKTRLRESDRYTEPPPSFFPFSFPICPPGELWRSGRRKVSTAGSFCVTAGAQLAAFFGKGTGRGGSGRREMVSPVYPFAELPRGVEKDTMGLRLAAIRLVRFIQNTNPRSFRYDNVILMQVQSTTWCTTCSSTALAAQQLTHATALLLVPETRRRACPLSICPATNLYLVQLCVRKFLDIIAEARKLPLDKQRTRFSGSCGVATGLLGQTPPHLYSPRNKI